MIQELDLWILGALNQFATRSWTADHLIGLLVNADTFKALPFVAVLSAYWLVGPDRPADRRNILSTLIGAFLAMGISRVWQNLGPMRARPRSDSSIDFVLPHGADHDLLASWSSFPSDTAALSVALAAGVFLLNRRVGIAALIWALVVVCIPRIYFGLHFASDILGGATIGILSVWLVVRSRFADWILRGVNVVEARWPVLFYACFMVLAFQISTYFLDLRVTGSKLAHVVSYQMSEPSPKPPAEFKTGTLP